MESDHDHHPTSEKPNDGDDQQGGSKVITRSYECNFCKRGFSNAQALGGHMNIHRKDKVKLKQTSTSNQTQPSLDNNPHQKVPLLWPWNESLQPQGGASSRDETHVVHIRQLPLFAGSPIITSKTQKPQDQVLGEITTDQSALTSSQGSSSELDLELRLGPDPEDSSATTGTRKFF